MHCMKTKYLISNLNSKGTSIGKLAVSAIVGMMLSSELFAAINNNEYVTVESTTPGVEEIYAVRDDFYVTTRGVSSPPFAADIEVTANSPWYLKRPRSGHLHLAIGENDEYQVGDGSSSEEGPGGRIYVLKLDIEQQETNVCWGSTSCKLNLTDDSRPGGEAVWSSAPAGISGKGKSVTFNPSLLGPGEYTVTAKSGIVPGYFDTCVVRVVMPIIPAPSESEIRLLGEEIKFVGGVEPSGLPDVNYSWRVTKGTCDPASAATKDFKTTLKSMGDIEVELTVAIGNVTCWTNRTIKTVRPEVTKLSWKDDHDLTKWVGKDAIVDPVWVKELGGAVLTNYPGVYTKNGNARAELFISASNQLTYATSVQVRGLGNKENFNAKGAIFHRWSWVPGELVLLSSSLYNSVNYYDRLEICWQYRVRKLSGGWGDWVDMNCSSHVLYTVDSIPAAIPLYDLGVDKACRYANGSVNYAAAINAGFAGDIYYKPTGCTVHDLGIFSARYGQCCCHAYGLSLLLAHVTSEHPTVEYCWGGCANDTICIYNYRGWIGPSFQCQRPAVDYVGADPHFLFHVEVPFRGTVYDPAYGLTGWAPMLEFAPAVTNSTVRHPAAADFKHGLNLPGSLQVHFVNWTCGH